MTRKDLKFYFVERFKELLNRNTIDSYRVKCNNVFSLMKELRSVIDNWLRGYVKQFETVCLCIDETLLAMKEDDILDYSFYDAQLMMDDLKSLRNADNKMRGELGESVIYLLDKCISCNMDIYLDRLYDAIITIVDSDEIIEEGNFKPLADRLSKIAGDLACELLNEGFSMRHLYRQSCKLRENAKDFDNTFIRFRQNHNHGVALKSYDVVLKMNGGSNNRLTSINGFLNEVPEDLVPIGKRGSSINKFLENRGALFYYCHVDAHDSAMAITYAEEQMESILDRAMLGYSILDVKVQKMALVIITNIPEKVYVVQPVNVMDSIYADDEEIVNMMIWKIDNIQNNDFIYKDVKDRLTSSLRHLRIGCAEADTGQQLINYWIAMEFLFSSPKAVDKTISRLEKNLLNVLMCCYANRRVSYINRALKKNGTLPKERDWWTLEDNELDDLINNQKNLLLRHHLQEMKAALRNTRDSAEKFFAKHHKHLYWQIYRIYRYRNKLIHEAAILPGLDNVIRCQRFYLVLLLNQLIGYFSETSIKPLSMDSFFFEYTKKTNVISKILKEKLTGADRISKLMQIEVYSELIRQNI